MSKIDVEMLKKINKEFEKVPPKIADGFVQELNRPNVNDLLFEAIEKIESEPSPNKRKRQRRKRRGKKN